MSEKTTPQTFKSPTSEYTKDQFQYFYAARRCVREHPEKNLYLATKINEIAAFGIRTERNAELTGAEVEELFAFLEKYKQNEGVVEEEEGQKVAVQWMEDVDGNWEVGKRWRVVCETFEEATRLPHHRLLGFAAMGALPAKTT